MKKPIIVFFTATLLTLGLMGCSDEGPAENAGERIDEAATDLGNQVEDACENVKEQVGTENQNC